MKSLLTILLLAATAQAADIDVIAYTIYTEARGESYKGKRAVASVIVNAATQKRRTLAQECLKPYRYEGMKHVRNTGEVPQWFVDARISALPDLTARSVSYYLAGMMLRGDFESVGPWNMFYSGSEPYWSKMMSDSCVIGEHTFGYLENL